jgi:hypothetical protein
VARKRDKPKSEQSLEGKTFRLVLGNGTRAELPGIECEDGSGYRPDFRVTASCPRCGGHADAEGWRRGGTIEVLARQRYRYVTACPDCAFGAWVAEHLKLPFHEEPFTDAEIPFWEEDPK